MSEEMMQTSPFECPAWFDGKKINETVFCEEFLRDYPMVTVNDAFFTVNGRVHDENRLKKVIYGQPVGTGQHGRCRIGRKQHHRVFKLRGVYPLQGRLSLWASAVRCAFGAASTFWKVTVRIIRPAMLMYGKEASNRKQEIDRQHYTIPNQRPKDKHCGKI